MSQPAIVVEGLGKRYRLRRGKTQARYTALRDVIGDFGKGMLRGIKNFRRNGGSNSANAGSRVQEDFWALRDVSFEIKAGDTVGIVGRNGAGKSTLLKILSRITAPTLGSLCLNGRLASLLEVGTGFHPELTGRENVFLNGSIMGMSRAEIKSRFDEIVAFAEVEKFLDTPVKHFSSGMYVRLAFSVAAHLEPEILIIDEVLAVGDAAFQKKCLGKMNQVAAGGRTVLFVSHNMSQITRICKTGIFLEKGTVKYIGDVFDVTTRYLQSGAGHSGERKWSDPAHAPGDEVARLRSVRIVSAVDTAAVVQQNEPVVIEMEYWNMVEGASLMAAFSFVTADGQIAFVAADFLDRTWGDRPKPAGLYRVVCTIPGGLFNEGMISVVAEVSTRKPVYAMHVHEFDAIAFQVIDSDGPGSLRQVWARDLPGAVRPRQAFENWQTTYVGAI